MGGSLSFLLAGVTGVLPLPSNLMIRVRNIGAWLCLLLWGGVHALQLEHAVAHHVADAGHGVHCAHHHAPLTTLPWDSETPVVKESQECPLCDWTGVPAMGSPSNGDAGDAIAWPVRPTLGAIDSGWTEATLWAGLGWRGPPVTDFS